MEDKINKRLEELYKKQSHLIDVNRVFYPEIPNRKRQIEDNIIIIRELETLLNKI